MSSLEKQNRSFSALLDFRINAFWKTVNEFLRYPTLNMLWKQNKHTLDGDKTLWNFNLHNTWSPRQKVFSIYSTCLAVGLWFLSLCHITSHALTIKKCCSMHEAMSEKSSHTQQIDANKLFVWVVLWLNLKPVCAWMWDGERAKQVGGWSVFNLAHMLSLF